MTDSGAAPPDLPGYELIRPLGRGGFADVFLYRQLLPEREVAIKVLRSTARTEVDRARFQSEANRMAALSSHPGIVTIYSAGVAPDDRPFLTMEYCPNEHFGRIVQQRQLSVARSLEVGIKVCAAVATAHHARILHRDIKPANVLLTEYDQPALTDFGIAGGLDGELTVEGMSPAFAAPEVLRLETPGDERSDVYSLAATVYALLARRSPFSQAGVENDRQLVQQVLNGQLPPVGRPDMPQSLEQVLRSGLSRDPDRRYDSAAAFGRALQTVEVEIGASQTPLSVPGARTSPSAELESDATEGRAESTRYRPMQRVESQAPAAPAPATAPTQDGLEGKTGTRAGASTDEPIRDDAALDLPTGHRPGQQDLPTAPVEDEPSDADPASDVGDPKRGPVLAVAAAVLVAIVIGIVAIGGGSAEDADADATTTTGADPDAFNFAAPPGTPTDLTITEEANEVVISWQAEGADSDDTYRVLISDDAGENQAEDTAETSLRLKLSELATPICAQVLAIRANQASPPTAKACGP